jgi:hypothetical protein
LKNYSISFNKNDIIDIWKNYSIIFNKNDIIDIWKNYSTNNKREWYYPDLLKTIVFNKAHLNINNFISDWKNYSINYNWSLKKLFNKL